MKTDFIGLSIWKGSLAELTLQRAENPLVINCINAWSFYCFHKKPDFAKALANSYNLPDGISIVWGLKWTEHCRLNRITGFDVLTYFLQHAAVLNVERIMFLGSSEKVLKRIEHKATISHPGIRFNFYSPSYNENFNQSEIDDIRQVIKEFDPHIVFVGLSAPKQEIFTHINLNSLTGIRYICNIGAAFEFYAGTEKRAPLSFQRSGLEGLYRYLFHPIRHFVKDSRSLPFLFYKVIKKNLEWK